MVTIVAPALRACDHQAPEVDVGVDRVRAPVDDEPAAVDRHRVGAEPAAADRVLAPGDPAVAQMVRSSSEAPSRWKNRRSRLLAWSLPIVP